MSAKGDAEVQEPTRAQRAVARRAAESRATVPHLELRAVVELADASRWGELPELAILTRACAVALREVPRANASYRDGRFELHSRINVGVALATEDAYAIPTVFDADTKSPAELAGEIESFARRALGGELLPPELSGATFTLSQSAAGVPSPLVVPPQAAALGASPLRAAPIVRDGVVRPGNVLSVTLACDHRILYGREADRFLAAFAAALSG